MKLTTNEKRVLNTLFKDVKGTTRNTMLIALYAAKPTDDESPDAQAMITLLNGLIVKLAELEQPEMEVLFAGIPYDVD
ncbi:MAG: hypothetical protein PWP56_1417 [Acetobacterium sp.]|jgi:hypothetical protein|uniref:hypothetical protein n=1 Tax=Acetobacterium sp. KB-1 TaxID=2184575 RepID=UPI000DBEB918|nr:hypothetical protein [Acetobacterium sp. KB-1]AWW26023.1 hypothetical protein DOZ58_04780 [Acetobacterium sp. KB-1]MDK2941904.1 hypothetical protein [Acetobacterium sp.]